MRAEHVRKPEWLKIRLRRNDRFLQTKCIVESHGLHTICADGRCPNQGECWGKGTATFLIGGAICTRSCRFCNTPTGKPKPLDASEPERVAESIRLMGLRHAVVTSVDRDDLPDAGAGHWVQTIRCIRMQNPQTTLEVLIPDFRGQPDQVDRIIETAPDIISHNLETVKRLTPQIRSAARYETSLSVLSHIASQGIRTKTGIMVGLGEREDEVEALMDDALRADVSILTVGQYLQPARTNIPVAEYVSLQQFEAYRRTALSKGFQQVESAPLVRSSYHAGNTA
ncbi:MAG: lipoyl synthase [Tannerella sp.]|jgi:lipoic acid synthetase|nr:lipoyl synthase [Tannerella sp.]